MWVSLSGEKNIVSMYPLAWECKKDIKFSVFPNTAVFFQGKNACKHLLLLVSYNSEKLILLMQLSIYSVIVVRMIKI